MSHIQQLAKTDEQKQQPARGFDSYGLVACLVISIFFIVWITLASKSLNFGSVVFLFALPWVLLRAGAIVTAALRFPSFFALDFLLGVTVVSVAVMGWTFFVPLSVWVLLIVLLVAVASIPKLLSRHRRDPLSALGLLSVIVSLVAATGWSQDLIFPTTPLNGTVVFKPWSDFFIHATFVARSLGAETLSQVGNYEWKGFPVIFYHYASYAVPICLAKVGSLPAYATVVGFWAPFGSFLTGLASYALGRAFWSQGAGLVALVATSLIPDLALLNIAHPDLWLFLAAARRSRRFVWCSSCWNSANTYRPGSARRTPRVDSIGSGGRRTCCFFQDSDLRRGFSAAGFLCHRGVAAAQAVAMANSWRLRGCRSGSAPAGESFLHRTERPLRSLRQRLVLAGTGEDGQRYTCRELVSSFQRCSSISFTSAAGDRVTPG